ncbi:oligosaccharyl transferase, archaeosortase A system-associated [Geoglobus acetivorans]|uniref:dolichyl-phosphooligosaccharide-protein glycotransferase n=1 Tax=Geoglobus acetivorans TaxID=565033 RepID=A0ABZ3H5C2_GEOAI|nr:oligosaccharyl transferase, archaeosortase A system-associated [Geoglobus acetivorans]
MKEKMERYWHVPFLVLAIITGLYLRIINPWDAVFVSWMEGARLSGNDPWYYFRLIDSAIQNFPNRIWFDAFTHYPYGTYIHFGPFLVYLGVLASMIAGATTPAEIRTVVAFIPAVGGALLAVPTYLLTKEIFGKKAGIISAFVVVLIPGQLMARSVLSFNDHHIWEVFWQVATLGTFILAYNRWKAYSGNLRNSRMLAYPIIAGICMGMYFLAWGAGFISVIMITFFIILSSLLRTYIQVDTVALAKVSVISFLVASVIYLPFSNKFPSFAVTYYSPFQLSVLLGAAAIVAVLYIVETRVIKNNKFESKWTYPVSAVAIIAISTILLYILSPEFIRNLQFILRVVQPKGGQLTIAEVQPFFSLGGKFSFEPAWQNFSITFFFALPAMFYYAFRALRDRNERYLYISIWAFAMLIALMGQNRFAYYFGVVSAVFSSAIVSEILGRVRFYEYLEAAINNNQKKMKKIGIKAVIAGVLLLLVLIYPTFSQANFYSKWSAGGINKQWYDTLEWMRDNTPGKEVYDEFYYQLYKPPESSGDRYPYYPDGVYSIISWWDYGHWITAIAHRIPVANPFQQGIGNKYNDVPGAAPFFTAFNESYADRIAEKLGVKYVVSDVEMATGKFYAMAVWAEGELGKAERTYYAGGGIVYVDANGNLGLSLTGQIPAGGRVITHVSIPREDYYRTMEAKFHIFDGSGLKHYRMVYESGFSTNTLSGLNELVYKNIYNSMYANKFDYGRIPTAYSGYVKVFEFVEGARITGKANGDYVIAKVTIKTNQGRTFDYIQKVPVVNGKYELVLPYAQDTSYPVKPVTAYTIESGGIAKTLELTEKQVENGELLTLDLT